MLLTNIGYGLSGLLAIGRDGGSTNPYIFVKGVRDIASGLPQDSSFSSVYGVHAATAAVMLAAATFLFI